MTKNIIFGLSALVLGLIAINSISPVMAYRGDASVRGPNYTEARHNTNVSAFEKNDYKAWVANMSGRGVTRFVTEANFKEFATAQLSAQKGDNSLINAFRTKYGMGMGAGRGQGMGNGQGRNK